MRPYDSKDRLAVRCQLYLSLRPWIIFLTFKYDTVKSTATSGLPTVQLRAGDESDAKVVRGPSFVCELTTASGTASEHLNETEEADTD
jgi:hypothetical protein